MTKYYSHWCGLSSVSHHFCSSTYSRKANIYSLTTFFSERISIEEGQHWYVMLAGNYRISSIPLPPTPSFVAIAIVAATAVIYNWFYFVYVPPHLSFTLCKQRNFKMLKILWIVFYLSISFNQFQWNQDVHIANTVINIFLILLTITTITTSIITIIVIIPVIYEL